MGKVTLRVGQKWKYHKMTMEILSIEDEQVSYRWDTLGPTFTAGLAYLTGWVTENTQMINTEPYLVYLEGITSCLK
jgi:hypothetical protein